MIDCLATGRCVLGAREDIGALEGFRFRLGKGLEVQMDGQITDEGDV